MPGSSLHASFVHASFVREKIMPHRRSDGPVTINEALRENVRRQKRRAAATASPPEAQRSPRERIKTAEKKRRSRGDS